MPKTPFEKAYDKLSIEEKKFLAELSDKERREALEFFCNPVEELPVAEREKYTPKEVRRILRKNIKTPLELTEDELNFIMMHPELVRKASTHTMKPFHDIVAKLDDVELEAFEAAANKNPALFTYKPPVTPTPAPPVAKPPPAKAKVPPEIVEEIEKEKKPKKKEKWRSLLPFKTSIFIKKFLMMRAEKGEGAYPYEVYRAFKNALYGIIRDEETREIFKEAGEIKLNGEAIDHELTAEIPLRDVEVAAMGFKHIQHPIYYVPSYQSFWKYFFILDVLELIRRRDTKIPVSGLPMTFTRQYYEIVPERIDDTTWEHPQEILYPLSWLGAKKIDEIVKDCIEEDWFINAIEAETNKTIEELLLEENEEEFKNASRKILWNNLPELISKFIKKYHAKIEEIAEEKGITVEELESIMREKRYIPEEKKKEFMQRRREDLKREEKYLREKK